MGVDIRIGKLRPDMRALERPPEALLNGKCESKLCTLMIYISENMGNDQERFVLPNVLDSWPFEKCNVNIKQWCRTTTRQFCSGFGISQCFGYQKRGSNEKD